MISLFKTISGLRCYLNLYRHSQKIGLVPTMGALHIGHLSLIKRAVQENDLVVVSIFVNPLQFGPQEDLAKYPRTLETDLQLCEQQGVNVVFAPSVNELYPNPDQITTIYPPADMINVLCGKIRIGHFQGVNTIVNKLFNIVQPDQVYFGQKDAQQVAIIQKMITDLNLPINMIICPTIRENSGLAFSSRNQYLTSEQKQQATVLYRGLQKAKQLFFIGERESNVLIKTVEQEIKLVKQVEVEYIELVEPNTLRPLTKITETGLLAIAAKISTTRLIDNMILTERQPIIAIDGPAGAGKSTVARQVAQKLGLLYLDTGAMYRALTWLVLESGIDINDQPSIVELGSNCQIKLVTTDDIEIPTRVWINEQEVTDKIRNLTVTSQVSKIAAIPEVRREMVKQQQNWGQKGAIVAEGRDIGTHVFPNAELKIFLTASVQERALRRLQDLQNQGEIDVNLENLQKTIQKRDDQDSNRKVAPLQKADDAIEIITDGLSITDVVNQIINLYNQRLNLSLNQIN